MKTCPYCKAENQDDAATCYFCGNHLDTLRMAPVPSAGSAEPTQPIRPRIGTGQARVHGPYITQQIPQTPPPFYPQSTAAYPPAYTPLPVHTPPPPPLPSSQPSNHLLPVLILGLAAVLLFACGFAVWTLTSATGSAAERLRAQVATQAANIFPPPGATSQPEKPGQPAEPTPWPTFTPQPTSPPEDASPTSDPTQAAIVEKLLSKGCSNALDALQKLSDQISSNPTIAFDAQWRANISQAVTDMKTNCGTLDAASPVPGLINRAHQNLALAQSEFDQAGKLFNQGVQDLDPNKLLEAGQHVQQAVKYLNQAITELRKIGN